MSVHVHSAQPSAADVRGDGSYVLHFESRFRDGRDFVFPCDSRGRVDLNALSDRIRNNYLYARAMMGHELSWPSVRPNAFPSGPSTCSSA